jgi:hypothetical protein
MTGDVPLKAADSTVLTDDDERWWDEERQIGNKVEK